MRIDPAKVTNKITCVACGKRPPYAGPASNGTDKCSNCWVKALGLGTVDEKGWLNLVAGVTTDDLDKRISAEAAKLFDGKVPNFEVKNFKTCRAGMENNACSFTLLVDGVKAAEVADDGNGGPLNIDFFDEKVEQRVARYAATLPPVKVGGDPAHTLPVDLELFVGQLLEKAANAKELEKLKKRVLKQMATQTLVSLKGDRKGAYHIYKVPFSDSTKAFLKKQHGDKLATIWNELDAAGLDKVCESLFH